MFNLTLGNGKKIKLGNNSYYKVITIAPLKSLKRCKEKIKDDYEGDSRRLVDFIRGKTLLLSTFLTSPGIVDSLTFGLIVCVPPCYSSTQLQLLYQLKIN